MKNITETHPSLTQFEWRIPNIRIKEHESYYYQKDVQENTIDKGVLKDILDNWKCNNKETRKTIDTLKIRLGLEEEK